MPASASFDDEDGYTLAAAHELLHGASWPYQAYQLSDWECGTRLVVWLAVPFTLLFGPSVLALKLTGLCISTLALAGLFAVCRRFYGLWAALFAALLFVLFPPPIYTYSVTAHGFHADSMALQLPFLLALGACFEQPEHRRRALLAGVLGGAAIAFAYISAMVVAAGLFAWLFAWVRRRAARPPLLTAMTGLLIGLLPMLVYNVLNGFRGLSIYHGTVVDYVAPTDLSRKVDWFERVTLPTLAHFTNTANPNDPDYGVFEGPFWVLAIAALLLPMGVRAARAFVRRERPRGTLPTAQFLDGVILLTGLFTVLVFFTSAHPVGPPHVVPLLVFMVLGLGARLGWLVERGRLPGRAAALAVLVAFLAYTGPRQIEEVQPDRLATASCLDGRNYPLFIYRARDVFDHLRDQPRLDAVRDLLMVLPFELAKNDEDMLHHGLVAMVMDPDPLRALGDFLRRPPRLRVAIEPFREAGLALLNLYMKERISPPALKAFLDGFPTANAARILEVLGYYIDPGHERFAALRDLVLRDPRMARPGLQAMARGQGRARARAVFDRDRPPLCWPQDLPRQHAGAFIEGLGRGLSRLLIREAPAYADERICPPHRAGFWQALRNSPPPTEQVLVPARGLYP